MKKQIIFNTIFVIFIFLFQYSFLSHFKILYYINLPLFLFIFSLIILNEKLTLYWTAPLAFLMETYNTTIFGIILLSFISTYLLINFLFKKFFTNNSLTTLLALGITATITYNVFIFVFSFLLSHIIQTHIEYNIGSYLFTPLLWQIVLQVILLLLGFTILNKFTKKMNLNFLN